MSEVKVSIIVPVYNVEKFLPRCLNTLINQTLQKIEIILINDGSSDSSALICEEYLAKDSRIKLLTQENAGQSNARNNGIKFAQGDYIGFVDSDDWVDENYFEKLYNSAIANNADIACAGFIKKGNNKHKIRLAFDKTEVFSKIEDKLIATKFLREPCVWNKIYKRELFSNNNSFFNEGMYYEDGIFSLKILYFSKNLVTVPNINYYYFTNQKSTVKTWSEKKLNDLYCSKQKVLDFLREKNIKIKTDSFLMPLYSLNLFKIPIFQKMESISTYNYRIFGLFTLFKTKLTHKSTPLLTVITITRNLIEANRKKDFIRCLNSVHNQTYDNIEHIVIDGASTDGTLELLNEYQEKGYIKYFSEPDSGIYNAFNKGIQKANGKYTIFLNSDDYWHKSDGVQKVINQMELKNADFAFGPAKLVDEKKVKIQKGKIHATFTRMPICHQTLFVKTDIIKKINGFDENIGLIADYDMFFRLLENNYNYTRVNHLFTTFSAGGASSISMDTDFVNYLHKKLNTYGSFTKEEVEEIYKTQALPFRLWKPALRQLKGLKDKYLFLCLNTRKYLKKTLKKHCK